MHLDKWRENKYELIFHEAVDGEKVEQSLGDNAYILNDEHLELVDSSDEEFVEEHAKIYK